MSKTSAVENMRQRLASLSPSLCLAKSKQVTLHLQNGHNHYCHHPLTQKSPLEQIKADPSALHNTSHKKLMRSMMLRGERPEECKYSWTIEDSAPGATSDRHLKSAEDWAAPFVDSVGNSDANKNVLPSYVEVSFSNACNFRCAYCGPYPTLNKHNNLEHLQKRQLMPLEESSNPYIQAFWKWWPELYPALRVFRITGGEPLLSANTFLVMDHIAQNPNPALTLAINSNLSVPEKQLSQFIDKASALSEANHLQRLELYTSIDTWGAQAEYLRHGLNLEQFQANTHRILRELPAASLAFMVTSNALSIFRFRELSDWILSLKIQYANAQCSISMDANTYEGRFRRKNYEE